MYSKILPIWDEKAHGISQGGLFDPLYPQESKPLTTIVHFLSVFSPPVGVTTQYRVVEEKQGKHVELSALKLAAHTNPLTQRQLEKQKDMMKVVSKKALLTSSNHISNALITTFSLHENVHPFRNWVVNKIDLILCKQKITTQLQNFFKKQEQPQELYETAEVYDTGDVTIVDDNAKAKPDGVSTKKLTRLAMNFVLSAKKAKRAELIRAYSDFFAEQGASAEAIQQTYQDLETLLHKAKTDAATQRLYKDITEYKPGDDVSNQGTNYSEVYELLETFSLVDAPQPEDDSKKTLLDDLQSTLKKQLEYYVREYINLYFLTKEKMLTPKKDEILKGKSKFLISYPAKIPKVIKSAALKAKRHFLEDNHCLETHDHDFDHLISFVQSNEVVNQRKAINFLYQRQTVLRDSPLPSKKSREHFLSSSPPRGDKANTPRRNCITPDRTRPWEFQF